MSGCVFCIDVASYITENLVCDRLSMPPQPECEK